MLLFPSSIFHGPGLSGQDMFISQTDSLCFELHNLAILPFEMCHKLTWQKGHMQVSLVQPRFNRLTVFDGRYPHGVRPVEGTRDPLKARLVLHGWFTEPTPFFDGKRILPSKLVSCSACHAVRGKANGITSRTS